MKLALKEHQNSYFAKVIFIIKPYLTFIYVF